MNPNQLPCIQPDLDSFSATKRRRLQNRLSQRKFRRELPYQLVSILHRLTILVARKESTGTEVVRDLVCVRHKQYSTRSRPMPKPRRKLFSKYFDTELRWPARLAELHSHRWRHKPRGRPRGICTMAATTATADIVVSPFECRGNGSTGR